MVNKIPTYWIAFGIVLLLIFWVATGKIDAAKDTTPEAADTHELALPKVAFVTIEAKNIPRVITLQGQVEAWRHVILESRLDTYVEAIQVSNGQRVKAGDTLLLLNKEDIPAQMAEARALAAVAKSELSAAQSLFKRGLLADTELKVKEAAVATAEASVARLERDLTNTVIKAPFDGIVESRNVEQGATVQKGTPLIEILDDRRLKLVGQVPQQSVLLLSKGDNVRARLLDGVEVEGELSFIGHQASTVTRTFRIEAELDNTKNIRLAGATATLTILTGTIVAQEVSPALLSLNAKGQLSVQHLSDDNHVLESPVERVKATNTALWVSGLPQQTRLITLGRGFVKPGQLVEAVPQTSFIETVSKPDDGKLNGES